MLNEPQLQDWLCKLNISDEAKDYINLVRLSEPSRRVQGGGRNVPGRYPSRKMGRTIQFESHRNELSFIYNLEYDSDVLEYWDQPAAIKLRYLTENGRPHAGYYTPDFLVIRSDRIGWVECKTESELLKLSKNQHRYFFDGERWRCPAGEEVAKQNGFFFEVFSSDEINWIYLRNTKLLEDYLRSEIAIIDETHERILSLVCAKPGISLSELLFLCQGFQIPVDNIYQLIAIRSLYVDLETKLLSEPDATPVFVSIEDSHLYSTTKTFHQFQSSEVNWNAGDSIIWDGKSYEVINCGELLTWLKGEDGNVVSINQEAFLSLCEKKQVNIINSSESNNAKDYVSSNKILLQASPSSLSEANRRYIVLTTFSQTGKIIMGTSIRTLRRWQKSFREAEMIFGNGYIGLIDNKSARGNRLAKLPPQTLELSSEFIENDFENSKQSTAHSVWVKLKSECEKRGIHFPSYNSFVRQINRRPEHEQDEKRRGRVAAYQSEEFYYEISPTSPKHGERPFEIVHIDHTELDIELVRSKTGKNLGRPWLTLAIDAYSRRCVGVYLTFDPPSYRSCMMVIRDMIMRYHRFPQVIVVDGGLDFSSIYFESLLAHYGCIIKVRPGKKPRFGTLIERLFLTTNKQFIYNLIGNTQLAKDNVRYLIKEFNPRNLAAWTIGYLHLHLCRYLFEVYDRMEHSTLGVSPREMFEHGLAQFGERKQRFIKYDENFRLMTLPTTKIGVAKVFPAGGVVINYIHYRTEHFRSPQIENKKVPVRFDPFNLGIAYAYVNGMWRQCISDYFNVFKNRSEREIQLATAEIKERRKGHGRFTLNAKILAEFLLSIEASENKLLLMQRQKDLEIQQLLNAAGDYSDYQLSGIENNTLKLLSGQSEPIPSDEQDNFTDDEDESLPDISTLKIFGDY